MDKGDLSQTEVSICGVPLLNVGAEHRSFQLASNPEIPIRSLHPKPKLGARNKRKSGAWSLQGACLSSAWSPEGHAVLQAFPGLRLTSTPGRTVWSCWVSVLGVHCLRVSDAEIGHPHGPAQLSAPVIEDSGIPRLKFRVQALAPVMLEQTSHENPNSETHLKP